MAQTKEQKLEYGRQYYWEHREAVIARQLAYQKKHPEATRARTQRASHAHRERKRSLVRELKSGGCTRCEERDPACLDFHHIDPATKLFRISEPLCGREEVVRAEVAKCVLLCSNCHRKQQQKERMKCLNLVVH